MTWQTLRSGNGYYRPSRRGVEVVTLHVLGRQTVMLTSHGVSIRDAETKPAIVRLVKSKQEALSLLAA